jgi:hypothetical protein
MGMATGYPLQSFYGAKAARKKYFRYYPAQRQQLVHYWALAFVSKQGYKLFSVGNATFFLYCN